jgi:ribosomal protein L37AE/L43A
MVKLLNQPVVVLNMHGNFLTQPNYLMPKQRRIKLKADLTQVIKKEEVRALSVEDIRSKIEKAFEYDEWQYQFDNKIAIKDKQRANHLNRVLYQCQNCFKEHQMEAKGTKIWCNSCGDTHELDIYGRLNNVNGMTKYQHVPDWFEAQRAFVKNQLINNEYLFEDEVYIDSLRNSKGFVRLKNGYLKHSKEGIHLTGEDFDGPLNLFRESNSLYSIHIEFNFKRSDGQRADAIIISTENDTYYCYPIHKKDVITKVRFAVEEAHKLIKS